MPIIFRPNKVGTDPSVGDIPENATAQLMHYFDCVCQVLDLDFIKYNTQKLRNSRSYYNLTEGEVRTLFMLCGLFSVDILKDKCIIGSDDVCEQDEIKFISLHTVQSIMEPVTYIEISDLQIKVKQILFYKENWISKYYHKPMYYFNSVYSHLHKAKKTSSSELDSTLVRTTSPVQRSDRSMSSERTVCSVDVITKPNISLEKSVVMDTPNGNKTCCLCCIL